MVKSSGPDNFDVTCDFKDSAQVQLNTADMIALRGLVASEILYYTLFTSYTTDGLDSVLKAEDAKNLSNADVAQFLAANPAFGKLRIDQKLVSCVTSALTI